jgi:hypothetical protein
MDLLDTRAGLLRASDALDEVALDKYSFTRDAFLQRRRNAVFDGEAPRGRCRPNRTSADRRRSAVVRFPRTVVSGGRRPRALAVGWRSCFLQLERS